MQLSDPVIFTEIKKPLPKIGEGFISCDLFASVATYWLFDIFQSLLLFPATEPDHNFLLHSAFT